MPASSRAKKDTMPFRQGPKGKGGKAAPKKEAPKKSMKKSGK